jgi:lipoprotein NlpI
MAINSHLSGINHGDYPMDITAEANRARRLVVSGDPLAATEIYEQIVIHHPTMGMWNCYGIALREAGLHQRAEAAFRTIRTLPDPIGYSSINVGAAIWCQGRYNDACEDWIAELNRIMSTKIKNQESNGIFIVCMLWWASQRLDRPELWTKLQPFVKKVLKTRGQQYPFGLAIHSFIAGTSNREQFLNDTVEGIYDPDTSYGIWNSRRLCQAWFYLAGKEEPGSPEWTMCLEKVLQFGHRVGLGTAEYEVAKHELGRYPKSNR